MCSVLCQFFLRERTRHACKVEDDWLQIFFNFLMLIDIQ